MKITIANGCVYIDDLDAQGKDRSRSMTLEQYERHARDAAFVAAATAAADPGTLKHVDVITARVAELAAIADAAKPKLP